MFTTASTEARFESLFEPVTLDGLNAKAAMLVRRDNKYIVESGVMACAMAELAQQFEMLEIEGRRAFTYDTCYFDDASFSSYHDHLHGRRRRVKVRVRRYVDSGMCFLEVKLKNARGGTVKRRLPHDASHMAMLDAAAREFIASVQQELYGRALVDPLRPTLRMTYERLTLVARDGGERATLDRGLCFGAGLQRRPAGAGCYVIETKSANGNGAADRVLRRLHQHPVNGCSKYCIGLSMTGAVDRFNRFRPALKRLGALERWGPGPADNRLQEPLAWRALSYAAV